MAEINDRDQRPGLISAIISAIISAMISADLLGIQRGASGEVLRELGHGYDQVGRDEFGDP